MKRFLIIFSGQVQGVGFRWTARQIADKYNVSGYVKNLANGCVEVQIEGNSDNLDAFLKEILEQRGFIRIDDYQIKEKEPEGSRYFEVRY